MKIGHIDHEISTFLVPGRKMCLLLPGTRFCLEYHIYCPLVIWGVQQKGVQRLLIII